MKQIMLNAYAKINLSIDVIGKRADGYHEVIMILQQIDLHDEVSVSICNGGNPGNIDITSDNDDVPNGKDNIAWAAASLMQQLFPQKRNEAIHINIKKRIPMAAGLGGGSADAAAVLQALNTLWQCNLSVEELIGIGVKLGADVPFCIMGQAATCHRNFIDRQNFSPCALARGIGEKLEPLPPLKAFVLLSKPPISVNTGDIYGDLNLNNIDERPDTDGLIFGLKSGDFTKVVASMHNVLEDVSAQKYPIIAKEKRMLQSIIPSDGKVMMSGSGPTVFALINEEKRALAAGNLLKKMHNNAFFTKTTC